MDVGLSLPTGTQLVVESRLFLLAVLMCANSLFEPPLCICNKADDDTDLRVRINEAVGTK